jgi:hypothetical protein
VNRTQKNTLKNYDALQALHRAMRSHQWQIWKLAKGGIYKGERKKSWWFAELYCLCGVRKFFIRDSIGRVVGHPRYEYPDNYRLSDLGLDAHEINEMLWLIVFERELANQTITELERTRDA